MSISNVYRENAQECLRIAETTRNERDKHLWITMGRSWLRLAEQTTHKATDVEAEKPPVDDSSD